MRVRFGTVVIALVLAQLAIVLWIFFAPSQLGGSSTYAVTSGVSMQPLLYKNDLAIVRAQSTYHVGDVVLYNSAVLGEPVLHRIILIQNGQYYFKGDNNDFVDPGYATRSELVGTLWVHVPEIGAAVNWLGQPLHAGLLAGFAAMFLVLAGGAPRRRRRRRHHSVTALTPASATSARRQPAIGSKEQRQSASLLASGDRRRASSGANRQTSRLTPARDRRSGIEMTPQQLAQRQLPRFGDGPLASLLAIAAALTLAVLCVAVGFSRPLHREVPLAAAYEQTGHFSYSAPVNAPTPVYPTGFIRSGQPIYPGLVSSVTVKFHYVFKSALAHHVHGSVEFKALLLSSDDTWKELSTIQSPADFTGNNAKVTSTLKLKGLYTLINKVSAQTNVAGESYSADIEPVVHVTGEVGGQSIDETFAPILPFVVTESVITLNVSAPVAPPGATYTLPTVGTETASTLNPVQVGSIPDQVDNVISVAKYQIRVSLIRLLGGVFAVVWLLLLALHELFRRRHTARSDEELIATRRHALIIPVSSFEDARGRTLIDIADFAHLAELAVFLERPILYEVEGGTRTYAVDDDLQRYVFVHVDDVPVHSQDPNRTDAEPVVEKASVTKEVSANGFVRASSAGRDPGRSGLAVFAIIGASVVALAVAVSLAVTFTASNAVPASSVGTSLQHRLISQLEPAGCASLSLTSLVEGSGTFANSVSNVLLLGSSGADTITDTGGGSCIVGGGGTNTITGTSTDICVSGPTLNDAAPCPVSNGVTAAPTSQTFSNNSGGQEDVTLTNKYSITAMTIVIKIAQTAGVTYSSESNSFPGGVVTQSSTTSGGVITYTTVLNSGQVIAAGYSNGEVYAQYSDNGTAHNQGGDTWSVTTTSNGKTSTVTGTF